MTQAIYDGNSSPRGDSANPALIAVAEFVNTIVAETQPYAGPERRCEPRYNVVMSAPAQPLDDSFHAVGEKFLAITRSLSNGGICFYYTKPIPQKYVAMQLANSSGEIITVVVEIRRCIARGTLFEIAGKFIERL